MDRRKFLQLGALGLPLMIADGLPAAPFQDPPTTPKAGDKNDEEKPPVVRPRKGIALDRLTGVGLWRFRAEGGISASPVIAGDQVYFGTRDGFLYALNRFNGEINWRLSLGASIDISPAFSGGSLSVKYIPPKYMER